MSRILFLNILILFIIHLTGCGGHKPIPTRIKNEFTLRHDGNNPGLAGKIQTNGYYVMQNVTRSDDAHDINMIFFPDGTFAYNFFIRGIHSNNPRLFFGKDFTTDSLCNLNIPHDGLYELRGDTIITQMINYTSGMAPWYAIEKWFIIINPVTVKAIFAQPIGFDVSPELLESRWHDQSRFTPARFVPTDTLPPSDNWLKGEKWLWRNEKDWVEYMENAKKRKK
jgi:hypothetical protein